MSAPDTNKCSCSSCGEHIEYPPEYEGMEFACPHCGQATVLQKPQVQAAPISASAPPVMGSVPPPSVSPEPVDIAVTESVNEVEPISLVCENCGAEMSPEEKVCVECGHRRASVRKWTNTAIFRLVAGIVLLGELAVLGLQWTTEGEPFGLRKRTRHAVLVKVGLAEEVDPAKQAAALKANTAANAKNVVKDPDLKLKSHEKVTDKDGAVMARRLSREEGIMVGYSAGSAVAAINQLKGELRSTDVVVVIFHDHGTRYVAKLFNDNWMKQQGFL